MLSYRTTSEPFKRSRRTRIPSVYAKSAVQSSRRRVSPDRTMPVQQRPESRMQMASGDRRHKAGSAARSSLRTAGRAGPCKQSRKPARPQTSHCPASYTENRQAQHPPSSTPSRANTPSSSARPVQAQALRARPWHRAQLERIHSLIRGRTSTRFGSSACVGSRMRDPSGGRGGAGGAGHPGSFGPSPTPCRASGSHLDLRLRPPSKFPLSPRKHALPPGPAYTLLVYIG
jgi:hypothetical protein